MKRREATAKRYARALFLLAREAGEAEAVGQELQAMSEIIAAHPELGDVLHRPWIKGGAKKTVISAVAEGVHCSTLVRDFLGLLAVRGRVGHLPEIIRVYRQLVDGMLGRARAAVHSAVALTERERAALSEGLGRAVGKQVFMDETVDPTLLGGFVARIGSLVLDGSLDGQLARLHERLVRGSG